MPKIKRIIVKYLTWIMVLMVSVILVLTVGLQILSEQNQEKESSATRFYQIEQILNENQQELEKLEEEYRQTCLNHAETIAYIIQYNPTVLNSVSELRKIAGFVEVDEIHIFDTSGCIIAGTHPEYWGYTLDSGEQIAFFKPMLTDRSLKLCQDIMPNTAEGKLMQYSALWSENEKFIVQVGMEPVKVMKVTEKNELSYIFALLRAHVGVDLYAIDAESGEVQGCTIENLVGKDLTEIGFDMNTIQKKSSGFHAKVNGVNSYCVFTRMDSNWIGRVVADDTLYADIPSKVLELSISLILTALIMVFTMTWYINKYVIREIEGVNHKLRAITEGKLDEKVDVCSSQELAELGSHINGMVESLLTSTDKISYVLNCTDLKIGVYEYNENMKNVRFTDDIPRILHLSTEQLKNFSADYVLFEAFLDSLRRNPLEGEEAVYCVEGVQERYVRLKETVSGNDVLGIIMDVTGDILKRKQMEAERDLDLLTGLYNRRGLEDRLNVLFRDPEKLGYSALFMIDADGLKEINDQYGHEKGDIYLRRLAEVLESFGRSSCIAARQGGDEFVLFLYNYESEADLLDNIQVLKYLQNHSTARLDDELMVPLRFSYGYSLSHGKDDYQQLLKEADWQMYENKRKRKTSL